jgi:hypothetical protein
MSRALWFAVSAAALAILAPSARADDGAISFGGLPRLLSGSTSVAMQSEIVRMTVGSRTVTVDCRFVFKNSGPACTVRMGFPDQGDGDESDSTGTKGTFLTYQSSVDGVPVPTEVLQGTSSDHFWHAKTVHFDRGSVRLVHDIYTTYLGDQIASSGDAAYDQTYYVLHTGSSWRGVIGRAEVDVTFLPGTTLLPIRLLPLSAIPGNNPALWSWSAARPGTVVYRGPCKPLVSGNKLVFIRKNFKPQYLDDILLYFHYRSLTKS